VAVAGQRTRDGERGFTDSRQATQFYETTILVAVSGQTVPVTFGVVPSRSLAVEQKRQIESLPGLLSVVGAEPGQAILLPNAWSLTTALALMLDPAFAPRRGGENGELDVWAAFKSAAETGAEFEQFPEPAWWSSPRAHPPTPLAVAEGLLLSTDIPFESSPLSGQSIASVVGAAAGAGLAAAAVGRVMTPWLLIAVPAGVVLMKAADGLAGALGDGRGDSVRYRLLRWLAPELVDRDRKH
jgi:hypothetical protein